MLIALALNNSAECMLRAGALSEAAALQRESLALAAELGMKHIAAFGLIVAARMAEQTGNDQRAVRLHAAGRHHPRRDRHPTFRRRPRAERRDACSSPPTTGRGAYEHEVEVGRVLDLAAALEDADETFCSVEASPVLVAEIGGRQP